MVSGVMCSGMMGSRLRDSAAKKTDGPFENLTSHWSRGKSLDAILKIKV
jgi:hypothetical protein